MAITTAPVKYNWNDVKTKLKQKFSALLDTEIKIGAGKKDENLKLLETRLGEIQQELHTIITELN